MIENLKYIGKYVAAGIFIWMIASGSGQKKSQNVNPTSGEKIVNK